MLRGREGEGGRGREREGEREREREREKEREFVRSFVREHAKCVRLKSAVVSAREYRQGGTR